MSNKSTDELTAEIKAIYDELIRQGVFPKRINLTNASFEVLEAELEAVGDQLERRKKWLGVN